MPPFCAAMVPSISLRCPVVQFIHALEQCGEKKGKSLVQLVGLILESDGPIVNNVTKADFVKFHDDKSTYTGELSC
jgi:hypothetical protein